MSYKLTRQPSMISFMVSTGFKPVPTNTSLIHQTLIDDDDNVDDDDSFPTDPSFLESPLKNGAIGGATVLGIILTTYACYLCCRRCCCQRTDIAGATLNMPRMIPLPSQFPINPSFLYKDEGITCLVNEG